MGKLFRSLRAENMRLYSGMGSSLAIAAVFIIALAAAWIIGGSGAEEITAQAVNAPTEYTEEITVENEIQQVISDSDIISTTDTARTITETHSYDDWRTAYRARFDELTTLNEEYNELIEASSGKERAGYAVKQQECVREAFIINQCLNADKAAGYSEAWNTVYLTLWLMLLPICAFAAAVMASKTAGEFKSGVMGTLYTLPVTRLKQYIAKYLSTALFALLLCASAWTGALFGAMIGCGGIEYTGEYVKVLGESVTFTSFFGFSIELGLCIFASALVLTAFCIAISTLSRSQGAAISLTVILCAGAMLFGKALGASGNIIGGLSIVSVLDVSAPLRGIPNYAQASYVVSWLCALGYWLVFMICGYLGMRRDVR